MIVARAMDLAAVRIGDGEWVVVTGIDPLTVSLTDVLLCDGVPCCVTQVEHWFAGPDQWPCTWLTLVPMEEQP